MKTVNIYLYNNSFISLLCLIKELIKNKIVPLNIKNIDYQKTLIDEVIYLNILEDEGIINEIINKVGIYVFNIIYYIFLSNHDNKEIIIFHFFVHSLKYKNKIIYMRNIKSVSEALKICKYVSRENHKMKGFLRFRELENKVLYAEFSPENNILFLLSSHFEKRLGNEYWIIKDVNRKLISIYDKNSFTILDEEEFSIHTLNVSNEEKYIEELWKNFYKTIGIKERKNDRCRMNFMPKKYWKYITEVRDEYEKSC
jgi:probable DNA metabolism protein